MCLGIPMKIVSIEGYTALCEREGVRREVNTFLLDSESLETGDFVMVHVGYAIEKIERADAIKRWSLFKQMQPADNT